MRRFIPFRAFVIVIAVTLFLAMTASKTEAPTPEKSETETAKTDVSNGEKGTKTGEDDKKNEESASKPDAIMFNILDEKIFDKIVVPKKVETQIKIEFAKLERERVRLEQSKKDLAIAEKVLARRIEELKQEKKELQELIDSTEEKRKERHGRKIEHLCKLASKMPPKDAAQFIEELELDVAVSILEMMTVGKAAKVMAEINPKRAVILSKRYLNRDELNTSKSGLRRRNSR